MQKSRARRLLPSFSLILAMQLAILPTAWCQEKSPPADPAAAGVTNGEAPAPSGNSAEAPASSTPAAPAAEVADNAVPAASNASARRAMSVYRLLNDASVAEELKLSVEQQTQIKQIIEEHEAALSQAPDADRATLLADAEKQLNEVLDADQRARWANLLHDQRVRLRFSFRFQPWTDVLEWFAEQADLSLVLDSPPPGTFNYSDGREYSVSEAIDLLNSVLLTKGYTLLRRERMLMLVDLTNGLPVDLVPQVELSELRRRGKYELVSVVFPIDNRIGEEVEKEVSPLLGAHGQIAVLPKTRQILVTETAGKMQVIAGVIKSMPQSEGDSPKRTKSEEPKPELALFPLKGVDAKATIDILNVLFPDIKLVHDAKANQLMAQTGKDKKAAIDIVLAQLGSEHEVDDKPRLEKHAVKTAGRADVLATLKLIVPEAILRVDLESGELIAWATPQQQALIRENIEKLGQASLPAAERQLEVHKVPQGDPATLLALLQKMLPEARLAADATTKSIVALASADDQRAIQATIEQLARQGDEKRNLKIYRLSASQRKRAQAVLTALEKELAGIKVVPDAATGDLSVLATDEEHARVAEVVDQISASADDSLGLEVATFRLKIADPASVLQVLQTLMPEAKFVLDLKAKQIVAWATNEEQAKIRATVEQLDSDLPADQRLELMSHPVGDASPDTLIALLRSILPEVQAVSDVKNNAVVAWARKGDQEVVRRAIEQAQPNIPAEERQQLVVYHVADADPVQVASMLTTILPTARFTGDRTAAKLVAWATPGEQETIKSTIEGMVKTDVPGRELTAVVYRPKSADVTYLLYDLRSLVPEARLAADAKNGVIIAWATSSDHEKIRATVEGLETQNVEGDDRSVAVYQAPDTDASTLMLVLQSAVPDAKFTPDARAGTVIAYARPDQHETLSAAVQELRANEGTGNKRVARVYRFTHADAVAASQVLRYLVPYAYLAVDSRTGSLAATALPGEHEQIAAMVAQLEGTTESNDLQLKVYEVGSTEPTNLLSMLRELFAQRPEVRLSVDASSGKLAAWALPAQHKTIQELVERVGRDGETEDRQIEVYALGDANSSSVGRTLTAMFQQDRNVKILPDDNGRFVTVWGNASVQASAKAVVDQMQGHKASVAVIPLEVIDPYVAERAIEQLFGDRYGRGRDAPRVDMDPDGGQLLVRGSAEQVAQIREMLSEMGEPQAKVVSKAKTGSSRVRVVPINDRALHSALEEIQRIWPKLRDNPIRVVTPSAVAPTVREDRLRREESGESAPLAPTLMPPIPSKSDGAKTSRKGIETQLVATMRTDSAASECETDAESADVTRIEPAPPIADEADAADAELPSTERGAGSPAIVIAPSGDSVTISSDDPEALDQFEQLLKSFAKRSTSGGREFAIFYLKRANANQVADTLRNVLNGGGFGFRNLGGATVVPDQRLNAVIVQGSRNDMETVDGLIQTLDSEETPENAFGQKPTVIPIKNTDADRVAEILRSVYKTRLAAGGATRQQAPLPQRMPPEMAALIQQMNAANTGPEMTLGVDSATNSLIVSAPPPLLAEVETLVKTLDEQSNASKPTVQVMALKHINTKALGRTLEQMIQSSGRRSRRSSNNQ